MNDDASTSGDSGNLVISGSTGSGGGDTSDTGDTGGDDSTDGTTTGDTVTADDAINLECSQGVLTGISLKSDGAGIQDFGIVCASSFTIGSSIIVPVTRWAIGDSVTSTTNSSVFQISTGFVALSYEKNADGLIYKFPTATGTVQGKSSSATFDTNVTAYYSVGLSCDGNVFTGFSVRFNDSGDLYQVRALSGDVDCSYSWTSSASGSVQLNIPDSTGGSSGGSTSGGGYCPGPRDGGPSLGGIDLSPWDDDGTSTCDDGSIPDAGQQAAEAIAGP